MAYKKKTKKLIKKDLSYIWHPFTQMQAWKKENFPIIEKGEGIYLYDTNGNKYIDGVSSLWCNIHGHKVKEIDNAITKQLDKIAHSTMLGLSNLPAVELAELLVKIVPAGLNKVFYSDSGSEAVEVALKMTYQYWQHKRQSKDKFITLSNSYHGDTIGSVSLGGIDIFHRIFEKLLFDKITVPAPYCYRCYYKKQLYSCKKECLDNIRKTAKKYKNKLAGIVVEPLVQGAGGMVTQPSGFLKEVEKIAREMDTILLLDEVATGFGRTGKMFACMHENVKPDILCIAKGITGGYLPLSATITSNEIYNAFLGEHEEFKTFFHGHTYTGNPLAAAASMASIKLMQRKNFFNELKNKIQLLEQELEKFWKLNIVGDIRQCGMMVGIELVCNREKKTLFPAKTRVGHSVILEARKRGVIIRPLGDTIILMPPLSINTKQLKELLTVAYSSIKATMENVSY